MNYRTRVVFRKFSTALVAGALGASALACSSSDGGPSAGSDPGTAGATSAAGASNPAAGAAGANVPGNGGSSQAASGAPGASGGDSSSGGAASGGLPASGGADGGSASGGKGGAAAGSGGAPGSGSGGGAGQGAYSPCPAATTPCKIMPLGDSITQGYRSTDLGGYRTELFKAALDGKKNITFVGSQSAGPTTVGGVAFPKSHEGHGGYTIDGGLGIQPQVVNWMKAAKPDIVTLMVGTNDVNNLYAWQTESAADLAAAPTRLGKLLDTILAQDSHVFLFVAQITPTTIDAENTLVKTYNDALPALVKARADAGKHIALVDMYSPFIATANYKTTLLRGTSDTLHPANAGYTKMGDIWYAAVKSVLP